MGLFDENIDGDPSASEVTFKSRIEALSGVSIGTDPSDDEASIYLRDGVLEVTNRVKELVPADTFKFTKAFIADSNTSVNKSSLGTIINVVREAGTADDWRACRFIGPELKARVTDKSSIHYASKFNPVYTIDSKMLEVYPAPDAVADRFKIYAVNKWPEDDKGKQLTVADSKIGWFPQDKVFLVVLYSAIKVLDKLVNAAHNMPTDLPNLALAIPTLPSTPSLSANSLSFSQAAPTYTMPAMTLPDKPTISDLNITAVPPATPTLSSSSVSFSQTAPIYLKPVVAPDFSDADTWINTEEDSEMLAARMQQIQGEISQYQADIQNNLNKFNEENAEYQAQLQVSIQDAQLSAGDDNQLIQKYQADLGVYQADVSAQVQEFTNNLQKEIQLWQNDRSTEIQKYQADLQNNLNTFNKENAQYQIEFQKAVQNAQLSSKDDDQAIQKYQAELGAYTAEVNREVQEVSKLSAETQNYSAQMQKVKMDIDIYHQRSMKLQQQYDTAFQFLVSPERVAKAQQQQQRRQ